MLPLLTAITLFGRIEANGIIVLSTARLVHNIRIPLISFFFQKIVLSRAEVDKRRIESTFAQANEEHNLHMSRMMELARVEV